MAKVLRAALGVRRVLIDPGPHPQWHKSVEARHRAEWPLLWKMIDELVEATEDEMRERIQRYVEKVDSKNRHPSNVVRRSRIGLVE